MRNEGSIVVLRPISDNGEEWIMENVDPTEGYQPYYPTLIVEHRYVEEIVGGMTADGLEVA